MRAGSGRHIDLSEVQLACPAVAWHEDCEQARMLLLACSEVHTSALDSLTCPPAMLAMIDIHDGTMPADPCPDNRTSIRHSLAKNMVRCPHLMLLVEGVGIFRLGGDREARYSEWGAGVGMGGAAQSRGAPQVARLAAVGAHLTAANLDSAPVPRRHLPWRPHKHPRPVNSLLWECPLFPVRAGTERSS